ncbi:hypothetical protein KAR91_14790 [Candidatus Pacearchaeota archaeon]|nr:hypothetical protein [Candidatus Pacearchaeota archaeon]
MPNKVTRKGPGVKALIKRLRNPGTVEVGIIDAGPHQKSEDMTVATIGFVHEFGSTDGNILERSFLRSTITGDRKDILALNKKLLKSIINGSMKVPHALGLLGDFVADKVSQKIVKLRTPPNKAATIRAKGSSNPLVDTGQLKNSITWEVNK